MNVPAHPPRRVSVLDRLLALAAPGLLSEPLVQGQFALELSRNPQLQQEPAAAQAEVLATLREAAIARLRGQRRRVVVNSISVASALGVAYFFRATGVAPMLPRPLLAIGSIISFAVGTVVYLGWRRQSIQADQTVAVVRPRLYQVLYWIGVCWGALVLL